MSIVNRFLSRIKQEMENLGRLETIPVGISDLKLIEKLGERFQVPENILREIRKERQKQIADISTIYPRVSFPVKGIYVFRGTPMSCYHDKDDLILFEGPQLISFKRDYAIDMFGSYDMWNFSRARPGSANMFPVWETGQVLSSEETYAHAETILNTLNRVDAGMNWHKAYYKKNDADFGFTWFNT